MDICVTGASSGLGRALCVRLIRTGHRVWGVARREEELQSLARELGDRFRACALDVTDAAALRRLRERMEREGGVPGFFVLCAGVQRDDMSDGGFDAAAAEENVRVNLQGVMGCIQEFLPVFLERRSGTFVCIGSTAALRPSRRSAGYAASKAALHMLLRSLRLRYAGRGVRFATVIAGPLATPMWEGRRSWLVPAPEAAARRVERFLSSRRTVLYYPFASTLLLRLTRGIPDAFFSAAASAFLQ
jgi:short-subunit dehydrogenase